MMQAENEPEFKDKKHVKNRVRVAIRVRPMISKQSTINENSCVEYSPGNHIIIGRDRSFGFDNVFSQKTCQAEVYEKCVKDLVLACFQGYNAAVLAYGQTGSGKTYTMGTSITQIQDQNQLGIIPRVIKQIFTQTQQRKQQTKTIIKASFIQIYNQQIIDLLNPSMLMLTNTSQTRQKHSISKQLNNIPSIRQEKDGSISLTNVVQQVINNSQEMLMLLHKGSANRSTSSTLMNDCSSRSHGIFSVHIEQHPVGEGVEDEGFITAKFYFVDLAGSERAKKTGASGLTLREGININLGLLELGNVISALSSAQKKQGQFITYRNSKLTRILQDSLGGNSNTYMICCISPAQSNYQQSLNTLKYATKAMNIKNKPIINRDPHSAQLNTLKQRILQLQTQNKSYKKLLSQSGISIPEYQQRNDPRSDILNQQIRKLRNRLLECDKKIEELERDVKEKSKRKNQLEISNYQLRRDRDKYRLRVEKQGKGSKYGGIQEDDGEEEGLIQQYQSKIRSLQSQLLEQEKINNQMQQQCDRMNKSMQRDQQILHKKNKQIHKLKTKIKSLLKQPKQKKNEYNYVVNSQPVSSQVIIKDIYEQNARKMSQNNSESQSDEEQKVQQIASSEDFKQAEADFIASAHAHKNKLDEVQDHIRKQQRMLQDMTEDQINLQYQLISEMKEEYHQKIVMLERQKQCLKKQQQQMAGYEKNPKLIQKIQNLQQELRSLRKKAKDQSSLQKQVAMQGEQIRNLANEIKAQKVQKIQINRKIKQDRTAFQKFKKQKIKQILATKKQNVKKDKQIRKLALQNKRKSLQIKKKLDQLNKAKYINQAIKSYNRQTRKNKSILYSHDVRNVRGKSRIKKQCQTVTNQQGEENSCIKSLCRKAIQSIIAQEEIKIEMNKYDNKIGQLEAQIEGILDQRAYLQIKVDRMTEYGSHDNDDQQYHQELQQLTAALSQLNERVDIIQENIVFCQHRYNQLSQKMPQFHQQADLLHNPILSTISSFQQMLRTILQNLREQTTSNLLTIHKIQQTTAQNHQLREQCERLRQQLAITINQHQINLARLRQEMMVRNINHLQQLQNLQSSLSSSNMYGQIRDGKINGSSNSIGNMSKMEEKDKKNYEKKIIDLTKINRQLSADVQMWRRKCSIVQEKYHNINVKMAKDKFIGRPREQELIGKKNNTGWNIGGVNSINSANTVQMIEQVNQMIDKMDNRKKGTGLSEDQQIQNIGRNSQDAEFTKNKWQCVQTLKASRSPILSMATQGNILATSGTKSITIWDQQTCQLIADLSNPNYLQGFVRSIITIPNHNLFSAACEKQVFIWDIRTYKQIAILKQHKQQVRCLYSIGNVLFTAGKGTSTNGGLMMWDLRMLGERQLQGPYDQKQKNVDIFAITSYDNTLYYGTRNHQVRRMNIENRQVLSPFQPPHMDTITSLTTTNNYIISGSKDKNLKLWSLQNSTNNLKCTTHAFNDYVNTLTTDENMPIFYAGSRDGQIKIATVLEDKIQFIGGIIAHTQSISSVCSVSQRMNGMFLTGSTDKTVKFWRPDPSTLERINSIYNQSY